MVKKIERVAKTYPPLEVRESELTKGMFFAKEGLSIVGVFFSRVKAKFFVTRINKERSGTYIQRELF